VRPSPDLPVVVVGGGIAGFSCARVLHDAGVPVRVIDRAKRVGGRMAVRTEVLSGRNHPVDTVNHPVDTVNHPVDIGASYFTVTDDRFAAIADSWRERGLAGIWTDTFALLTPQGLAGATTGIPRWSASAGLRSLVEDLATGIPVTIGVEVEEVDLDGGLVVDGARAAAVVLAVPEPQGYDLLPEPVAEELGLGRGLDWAPTIAIWAAWPERWWPELNGAFVDGSPVVSWIADDGSRRGDGAAVLVAHVTGVFAAGRLDQPGSAVRPVLAELGALLGAPAPPEPLWSRAHRWALASPRHPHDAPYALHGSGIGVCGDAWGPRPRVEQAWTSGYLLGAELLTRCGG
jgi:predicted NAD/FAD-dependent oxidoreductase